MPSTEVSKWPERPVYLNHLHAMGICMSLQMEKDQNGLSEPQEEALERVHAVLGQFLSEMYK